MTTEERKEDKEEQTDPLTLLISLLGLMVFFFVWTAGVVYAKGFWMTLQAVCNPFYGLYKVVEKILSLIGWL